MILIIANAGEQARLGGNRRTIIESTIQKFRALGLNPSFEDIRVAVSRLGKMGMQNRVAVRQAEKEVTCGLMGQNGDNSPAGA